MILSTHVLPGSSDVGPQFHGYRPGQVQELPYKTPWDDGDRWHLSELCAELGIPHRDGERKAVLLQMLVTAHESQKIDLNESLVMLSQIVAKRTRKVEAASPRQFVPLKRKDVNVPDAPPAAAPPSPESELWGFARMTTKDLIRAAGERGLKFKGTAKREEVFAALEKHLKG